MGDWMRLSREDEALFNGCKEDESIVLLDGNWTKMPRKMIGLMTMDAYMRATEDALVKLGVKYGPQVWVATQALRERTWQVMAPHYLQRLHGLVEQFSAAKARGAAGEDVVQVAEAAAAGRVATLLIDADRHVRGRFDAASGRIEVVDDDEKDVGFFRVRHGSGRAVIATGAARQQ